MNIQNHGNKVMKIKKIDTTVEKKIITGLIIDDLFCSQCIKLAKPEYFKLEYARLIIRWVNEYYEKYDSSPGKNMYDLFEKNKKSIDKTLVEIIEIFLDKVSQEHETTVFNSRFQIDLAKEYFKERAMRLRNQKVEKLLDAGKIDEAVQIEASSVIIEENLTPWYNPLSDEEIKAYFTQNEKRVILNFEGALGELVGGFERNNLVAITGPEKRGKCVDGDCKILLPNGSYKRIEDVVSDKDSHTMSLNLDNYKLEKTQITDWLYQGEQDVYEVITKTGRSVNLTINHPLLVDTGKWKKLEDIKVGDFIAVPQTLSFFGTQAMPLHQVRLLSYLIAEGCFRNHSIGFTNIDKDIQKDFEYCVIKMGDSVTWSKDKMRHGDCLIVNGKDRIGKHGSRIKTFINECELNNVLSKDRKIPDCVFNFPKRQLIEFLKILFTCDGSIFDFGIDYTSASKQLSKSVQSLLLKFGIISKLRYKNNKCAGAWTVEIRDSKNIIMFCKKIGFIAYKKPIADKIIKIAESKNQKSFLDKVPNNIGKQLRIDFEIFCKKQGLKIYENFGKSKWRAINYELNKGNDVMKISYDKVVEKSPLINKYLYSDIIWDKIESINFIGKRPTYDIEVEKHHNFVAEDIIVHNTWWLQELVKQAISSRLKVIIFSFEMNKEQTLDRYYAQLSGMKLNTEEPVTYPVFDCEYNQTGECNSKKRENKVNNLLYGLADDEFPRFDDFPKYQECTVCRGTRDFKVAVWHKKQDKIKKLTYTNLSKKIKGYATMFGSENLRIVNYPSFSAGAKDMENVLKLLIADDFVPDVIINDYIDIQQKEPSSSEREGIYKLWQNAKRLTAEYNCVHITADQANSQARNQESLKQNNFSDDKRKDGILDFRIGLNQTDKEKQRGIMRINVLYRRMGKAVTSREVMVLQCLELGQTYLDSEWIN